MDFVTFNNILHLLKHLVFMCSDLNNLSLLTYFQFHYYFIYRVNDVRVTKQEIQFNLNLHHNAVYFQTIFNCGNKELEEKKVSLRIQVFIT